MPVFAVAYREVADVISAEGVVEAVRQSTLAAQIAGQIMKLKVKVGDSVKAGQVLRALTRARRSRWCRAARASSPKRRPG